MKVRWSAYSQLRSNPWKEVPVAHPTPLGLDQLFTTVVQMRKAVCTALKWAQSCPCRLLRYQQAPCEDDTDLADSGSCGVGGNNETSGTVKFGFETTRHPTLRSPRVFIVYPQPPMVQRWRSLVIKDLSGRQRRIL